MDYGLSPQQLAVICALSSGATTIAAAEEAGVHRNTLSNWRRNSLPFQEALAHAQYDRALHFREKTEALFDLALQSLQDILTNPKTPPSVRLRAALAIIQTASTAPEPKKQISLDIEKFVNKRTPPQTVTEDQLAPARPEPPQPSAHKDAQTTRSDAPVAPPSLPANPPPPPTVHKTAQPIRNSGAKIGRNELCPCGSGNKYKRCCLKKPGNTGSHRAAA